MHVSKNLFAETRETHLVRERLIRSKGGLVRVVVHAASTALGRVGDVDGDGERGRGRGPGEVRLREAAGGAGEGKGRGWRRKGGGMEENLAAEEAGVDVGPAGGTSRWNLCREAHASETDSEAVTE
jgi:hypothetical protein